MSNTTKLNKAQKIALDKNVQLPVRSNWQVQSIPLRALYLQRHLYILPPHQREEVYEQQDMQLVVDTVMRGGVIPPIMVTTVKTNGVRKWEIQDGQQKIMSLFHFMDGDFPTISPAMMHHLDPTPGLQPLLHWSYTYEELTSELPEVKDAFDNMQIPIFFMGDMSDVQKMSQYWRFQTGKRLSTGERFRTFHKKSKASIFADEIKFQPFWKEFWKRPNKRQQTYQMAVMAVYMEAFTMPANVRTDVLAQMTGGRYDEDMTDDVLQTVSRLLPMVGRLFKGIRINSINSIIVLYEAVHILEEHGFDLPACQEGALAAWFSWVFDRKNDEGWAKRKGDYTDLRYASNQSDFWSFYQERMLAQPGLVKIGAPRTKEEILAERVRLRNQYLDATL